MTADTLTEREEIARIIDPRAFEAAERDAAKAAEWHAKADEYWKTEDASKYPYGQISKDRIFKSWKELAERFERDAAQSTVSAFARADAILARRSPVGAAGVPVTQHDSDCAVHNAPAYPNGLCDCGASEVHTLSPEDMQRAQELLQDPDAEDNERFASWFGSTLLEVHKAYVALLAAPSVADPVPLAEVLKPFLAAARIWAGAPDQDDAKIYMDLHADAVAAIEEGSPPSISDPEFTVGDFRRLLAALSTAPAPAVKEESDHG